MDGVAGSRRGEDPRPFRADGKRPNLLRSKEGLGSRHGTGAELYPPNGREAQIRPQRRSAWPEPHLSLSGAGLVNQSGPNQGDARHQTETTCASFFPKRIPTVSSSPVTIDPLETSWRVLNFAPAFFNA